MTPLILLAILLCGIPIGIVWGQHNIVMDVRKEQLWQVELDYLKATNRMDRRTKQYKNIREVGYNTFQVAYI